MTIGHRAPGDAGRHWARVASRRLKLATDAEIVRQVHRGNLWYVVRDTVGDRYYRISPSAYYFLSLLDGTRTVEDAYRTLLNRLGDDACGETEIIKLLWRLNNADMLHADTPGRTEDSVARVEAMGRARIIGQLRSPLAIRVPLLDPARMMDALGPLARLLFSWPAFLAWLTLLGVALIEVAIHWQALSTNFSDRVLSFDNLVLMWFVFPAVKLVHEMGHGLALKRFGRRTHEFGIMFLVFMPVPYVDASSSATLTRPGQRALVGAAGLYFELAVAALATLIWVSAEPGLLRAVCFNVMIVGGASAVLFNGNPLLKFDAYYILSDLLEMPNLGQRSSRYWLNAIQKHLLGIAPGEDPREAAGETPWLALYAPASLVYRLFLMASIALFVAKQFFFLGTALALLAIFNILVMPLVRAALFLARSARLAGRRPVTLARVAVAGTTLAALLFWVPLPDRELAQGVVWYRDGVELTPETSGTVEAFLVESGERVEAGGPVARLVDPEAEADMRGLAARLDALRAQYRRELSVDRGRAPLTAEEILYVEERLKTARDRAEKLVLAAPVSGQVVIPRARDHDSGWLGRGTPIGHIVGTGGPKIIAALRQSQVDRLNDALGAVEVRFSADARTTFQARLSRVTPQATDRLPAPLLSAQGGGPFSLRQNAPGETGLHALERVFLVEVEVDAPDDLALFGSRAWVRLDFGRAPAAEQAQRALRRLFLREFDV